MKTKEETIQAVKDFVKQFNELIADCDHYDLLVTIEQEFHPLMNAKFCTGTPPLTATISETVTY